MAVGTNRIISRNNFLMNRRTLFAAVFLLIGLAAGWMAWLMWRAGEDGKWLFGVFAAFFLVLAVVPFLPSPKKKPEKVLNTRFVPAWQMEGMILLALLAIIVSVVAHCAHVAK
jgi:Ca2+/Na+ antiporter